MRTELEVPDQIEVELLRIADELSAASQTNLQKTLEELVDLERQLTVLMRRRDALIDARQGLATYRPKRGAGVYSCPNCWVSERQTAVLQRVAFAAPREEVMRCASCGRDFGIPAARRL